MTISMSAEKRELIKKLQEAVGRSPIRLKILKEINKKESVNDLIKRLQIPQPTVSQAVARFHQGYGLITPIKKKDNSQVFDKIPLLKQIGSLDKWVKTKIEETEEEIKIRKLKVRPPICSDIPFLDFKIEQDARKMAEGPYHLLYLLENSIRKFIDSVMTKKYGTSWWQQVVTNADIQRKVNGRKKLEEQNKWHVPRGEHELFYTDLEDLTYFLNREKSEFEKHLGDVDLWITKIKKETKLSRNIVDHHNPLPQREINRLAQILEDWKRQLKGVKI
jgi:DNA-binding transcriptional ArsR family regulator